MYITKKCGHRKNTIQGPYYIVQRVFICIGCWFCFKLLEAAYVGLKMRAVLGHCLFLTLVMYALKKSDRIIK